MPSFNKVCHTGNTLDSINPPERTPICPKCEDKGKREIEINHGSQLCANCPDKDNCLGGFCIKEIECECQK